jgi:hypothetical protein
MKGTPSIKFKPMKRILILAFVGLLLTGAGAAPAPDTPPDADKVGTISGIPVKRPQGGWLGVELKDSCFVLTFYDEKKKPVAADRSSAVFRWPVHYQPNSERTELVPTGDPAVFASQYAVKAPYTFKLFITLLTDGSTDVETYTIDFSA